MIGLWKSYLLERAGEWGLPTSGDWTFLFNNNHHPHCTNLNILWFHGGDEFPRVVTKLYREPEIIQREYENLVQAYSTASQWVPRPLYFGRQAGFWAMWMQGLPGMRFQARKSYPSETLTSLVETVASIHSGLCPGTATGDACRHRRAVTEPIETLVEFGESPAVREGCASLAAAASGQWLDRLPAIPQHGDLFFSNVLVFREQWYFVDWETFGVIDLPFYDLLTLLFSLLRAGGETPSEWQPSLMKQIPGLVKLYALRLRLACEDVRLLLPLVLVNWFHLQWLDGRQEFTRFMYRVIRDYFERPHVWESVFVPSPENS